MTAKTAGLPSANEVLTVPMGDLVAVKEHRLGLKGEAQVRARPSNLNHRGHDHGQDGDSEHPHTDKIGKVQSQRNLPENGED